MPFFVVPVFGPIDPVEVAVLEVGVLVGKVALFPESTRKSPSSVISSSSRIIAYSSVLGYFLLKYLFSYLWLAASSSISSVGVLTSYI